MINDTFASLMIKMLLFCYNSHQLFIMMLKIVPKGGENIATTTAKTTDTYKTKQNHKTEKYY